MSTAPTNVAVSKRSARPFSEDEMDKTALQIPSRRSSKQDEFEADGRSRQCSTSTSSSRQPSPMLDPSDPEQAVGALLLGGSGRFASYPGSQNTIVSGDEKSFMGYSAHHELLDNFPLEGRPLNFGIVVPGVYRSSFPQPGDYDFVRELKLKTIVTLVQKDFPEGYTSFMSKNGINHRVFNMKGTKKEEIPIKTMKAILKLVLDRRNHPLLIHCNHGKHRTGCVVGIVRKVSGWDLGNIIHEYKTYAEPKVRDCDINYISGFELADISNLFREASWRFRTGRCLRVAVLALFMVVMWLFSKAGIATAPKRNLLK